LYTKFSLLLINTTKANGYYKGYRVFVAGKAAGA